MKSAFIIVALIFSCINSIVISTRFSSALSTYKKWQKENPDCSLIFKKWAVAYGILIVIWMASIILGGIFIDVKLLYSLIGFTIILEFFFDFFEGERSKNFEISLKLNRRCFLFGILLYLLFSAFVLAAVLI